MGEHTPGPWEHELVHCTDRSKWFDIHKSGLHKYIAGHARAASEADARLMAAAPDLLEACEAAILSWHQSQTVCLGSLRAAVAKAKGTTP